MKFKITKTSEWGEEWFMEINTLEELMAFEEQCKSSRYYNGLILWWSGDDKELPEIEIYDDYKE